jgi:hypothetical protein
VDGGPGKLVMTLYFQNFTGPSIMNCTFSDCSKNYGDGGQVFFFFSFRRVRSFSNFLQVIQCASSQCCTQGYALKTIIDLMNLVHGETTVTISPTGFGTMTQTCMPMPIEFQCEA